MHKPLIKPSKIHAFCLLTLATAASGALAQVRPPVVDSTGIKPGVVGTLPPAGISSDEVNTIVTNNITNLIKANGVGAPGAPGGLPPGYREVNEAMGTKLISEWDVPKYAALGYGVGAPSLNLPYGLGTTAGALCDGKNTPSRVVGYPAGTVSNGESGSVGYPAMWAVCEPNGTRTTLVKVVGAQFLTLALVDVNGYKLAGTEGVNAGTAGPICRAKGYADYVATSLVTHGRGGGCHDNERVTAWNGAAFQSIMSCYNTFLDGVQCWK